MILQRSVADFECQLFSRGNWSPRSHHLPSGSFCSGTVSALHLHQQIALEPQKKKKPCWKSWRIMVDWLVLIEEILPIKTRPPLAVVFLCVHPRWGEYKYSYFVWTGLLCVCRRTLLVPCPSLFFFLSRLRSEPVPAGCNSPGGCSAFVFVFCQDD